jgi:hypothetical protein
VRSEKTVAFLGGEPDNGVRLEERSMAMIEFEDRTPESSQMFLRYLDGRDPWQGMKPNWPERAWEAACAVFCLAQYAAVAASLWYALR